MTPHRAQRHRLAGFTLVEMLFTLAIGTFIVAGVLTSYVFSLRGFRALSNYDEIQTAGRRALDLFARDMRVAIYVSYYRGEIMKVVVPTDVSSSGVINSTQEITHWLNNGAWYRIDGSGNSKLLAANVDSLKYTLYDAAAQETKNETRAVSVGVDVTLKKYVQSKQQTTHFLSARYRLRNIQNTPP